jgi:23S rRNA (adenine2030-N6)-methyltransferase
MFSYQHRYHAGGFADVHKHIGLMALLQALQKKPKPYCVLDAYAGEGIYDLQCDEAQKIKEYLSGFWTVLKHAPYSSGLINDYLALIKQENEGEIIRYYPGSSAIIRHYLREQDRALLVEKHPQALHALRINFKLNKNIHIHDRDAEEAMVALVPFKEKRGLIFIDPSYEVKSEYQRLPKVIARVHERFSNAVIALWYPILADAPHEGMIKTLQHFDYPSTWISEWAPHSHSHAPTQQMQGSGMFIINTPWQVDEQLSSAYKEIGMTI